MWKHRVNDTIDIASLASQILENRYLDIVYVSMTTAGGCGTFCSIYAVCVFFFRLTLSKPNAILISDTPSTRP